MGADRLVLDRLRRIERVRAAARQTAAMNAAEAEGTLGQLLALHNQTREISGNYDLQNSCDTAAGLQGMCAFLGGIAELIDHTETRIGHSRSQADQAQMQLLASERRRAIAEDRLQQCKRSANTEKPVATPARKRVWHDT